MFIIIIRYNLFSTHSSQGFWGFTYKPVMPPRTHATVKCPHCEHTDTSGNIQRHLSRQQKYLIAQEAIVNEPAAALARVLQAKADQA
jgi:hypothetical protein